MSIKPMFSARIWAKGADLGEQLGTVGVNKNGVRTDQFMG